MKMIFLAILSFLTAILNQGVVFASCAPSNLNIVSVMDCGADNTGKTRSDIAIQAAITAAQNTRAKVYFPAGSYLIEQPITGFSGITLMGQEGAYSYSNNGVGLSGMPSVLVASSSIGNQAMLNFTSLTNTAVLDLGFNLGTTSSYAIEYGNRQDGTAYPNHQIDRISVYGGQVGIRARNANLLHIRNSNFSDIGYIAIWLDAYCGDSDIEGNYINGTYLSAPAPYGTPPSNPVDPVGAGIFVGLGSGNLNIRGGKIEWNEKGILISDSQGITVTGINFDTNVWGHVIVYGYAYVPEVNPRGIIINGNRFLSGGTQGGESAVYVDVNNAEAIVNIVGNSFRMASNNANDYDGSPEDPMPNNPSVGPAMYGIRVDSSTGSAHVNVSGNEMFNCAALNSIGAYGPAILVHDTGNLENMPDYYGGGAAEQ